MSKALKKKYFIILGILVVLIMVYILYLKFPFIEEIINLIMIGGIIAYILKPLRDLCVKKFNISKRFGVVIILLVITIVFVNCVGFIIPAFIEEIDTIGEVISRINKYFFELEKWLKISDNTVLIDLYGSVQVRISKFLTELSYSSLEWIIEFSQNLMSYIIVPIVAYYFLSDADLIGKKFYLLIPIRRREVIKNILKDVDELLQRYIVSQLFLCGVTVVLSLILFLGLGLKFAFVLAIINGVFNIVPYFGAFFGGVPAVFIAFLTSPTLAIWTLIGVFIVQQIEGNIIAPKITGDSTDIHPLVIVILLIIGEKIGGVFGMILIVPLAVIIKVVYDDINYYIF